MGGRRFAYFFEDGCKLDRFLVCPNFLAAFPFADVTAFPREFSDHSPIILRTSLLCFGPPPFRFFNSWCFRYGFDNVVIQAWNSFSGEGVPDRYLANKLKWVKEAIRGWRRVEFEKENKALRELKYKVNDL